MLVEIIYLGFYCGGVGFKFCEAFPKFNKLCLLSQLLIFCISDLNISSPTDVYVFFGPQRVSSFSIVGWWGSKLDNLSYKILESICAYVQGYVLGHTITLVYPLF